MLLSSCRSIIALVPNWFSIRAGPVPALLIINWSVIFVSVFIVVNVPVTLKSPCIVRLLVIKVSPSTTKVFVPPEFVPIPIPFVVGYILKPSETRASE